MGAIWFLSKERNIVITGFNRIIKENGDTELWVKETDGSSRKLAEGQKAIDLENALLDIAWNTYPSVITDGNGQFGTNINVEEEVEE